MKPIFARSMLGKAFVCLTLTTATLLGGLISSPPATATEVIPLSLNETVRQADAIVLGTVTAQQSRWGDSSKRWIATDFTLTVEDVIHASEKGSPIQKTITLTYWGGTLGGETQAVSDMRLPKPNEHLLLILRPDWQQNGFTPTVGFNQGLFSVTTDKTSLVLDADGQPLVLGDKGNITRSVGLTAGTANVDLPTFTGWLRANINAIKAAPPPQRAAINPNDPRVLRPFAKTPEAAGVGTPLPLAFLAQADARLEESAPGAPNPPTDAAFAAALGTGDIPQGGLTNYSTSHQAHLPIVINQFPSSFSPWSPEDQYQMSKWNYYASNVFRVYTTPTGTYGWPNGRFDLAGWPSSASLQSVYGTPWGSNTLGVTFLRYDSNGWIIEADVALNPAFSWTLDDEWVYDSGPAQSFRETMTHELGHVHGLDHQFNFLSVMNYSPAVYRAYATPFMDDAQGIRFEYPGNVVGLTDLAVYLFYSSGYQSWSDASIPATVVAGSTLTVTNYHIENVGTTTISTPTIEWYLTKARNYGSSYYALGQSTYSSLPPFTYFTPSSVARSFTVPTSVPSGDYYLAAYIRNDGGAGQSSFPFSNNYGFSRTKVHVNIPNVNMSINDVTQAEGNTGATAFNFTVSLATASTGTVTVNYATANGTATAGSDYAATSGVLTFAPGQTSKTVTVNVTGDTTVEPNETFYVNLSGASGATIVDAQGAGTIVNDDVLLQADFVVTSISLSPASPTLKGTFSAIVTVKNQGTAAGNGGYLDVWANQPVAQTCPADGNGFALVGTLAAGASKTFTITGLAAGTPGAKTLRAFVDSSCLTTESNESNNQLTQAYTVGGGADFVVTGIVLSPTGPKTKTTFSATVTVKNQGTAAGDGRFLDVWANQSAVQTCQADGNASAAVGVLAAGASKAITLTGLPAGAVGSKTFRAFVDSYCQTVETNESNNQSTAVYSVVP